MKMLTKTSMCLKDGVWVQGLKHPYSWWTPYHPGDVLQAGALNWTHRLSLIAIGLSGLAIMAAILLAVLG